MIRSRITWHASDTKAEQVTFDDALLDKRHPTVRARERPAALREAAAEYLKKEDAEEIDRRHRAGYGDGGAAPGAPGIDDELDGWAAEGRMTGDLGGGPRHGASTISQQTAKNALLTRERA